jgi:hypothetical protein
MTRYEQLFFILAALFLLFATSLHPLLMIPVLILMLIGLALFTRQHRQSGISS